MGLNSEHALLSPSGMNGILCCTGRPLYCRQQGIESEDNPASIRGTWLHELAASLFTKGKLTKEQIEKTEEEDLEQVDIAVAALYQLLGGDTEGWVIEVEEKVYPFADRVGLSALNENCWGTADIIAYNPELKHLVVADYKFGYNYVVALANPQLKIYLEGARRRFPKALTGETAIIQPQHSEEAQTVLVDFNDLDSWLKEIVVPKLSMALSPETRLTPGPHCRETYCPADGNCPAQAQQTSQLIGDFTRDLVPPGGGAPQFPIRPTMERLEEIVDQAAFIEGFLKAAKAELVNRIKNGEVATRKKLVPGKRSRAWTSEEEADKFLRGQKLKEKERYKYKLLSPAQAEKALKEKIDTVTRTKNRFEELVQWKEGNPMLVDIGDPRPALEFGNSMEEFIEAEFDEVTSPEEEIDLSDLM